jgi:hypothetical protein
MTSLIAPSLTMMMMSDRKIKTLVWRSRLAKISPSDLQPFFVDGEIAPLFNWYGAYNIPFVLFGLGFYILVEG